MGIRMRDAIHARVERVIRAAPAQERAKEGLRAIPLCSAPTERGGEVGGRVRAQPADEKSTTRQPP